MQIVDLPEEKREVEWQTVALAAVIYGMWFAATWWHEILPIGIVALLGAISVAWHMNMQHETIHGHPTRNRFVNTALATWPLALWLPYEIYRHSHLRHHNEQMLTDPLDDPESYYWTSEQWDALGPVGRALIRAQSVMIGRLVIGPGWSMYRLWADEIRAILAGDRARLKVALSHAAQTALVLVWVMGVCKMSFLTYFFLFAYAGTALALIRSFAEHKAEQTAERRTAIVENATLFGPLFLFNNLHVAHHVRATVPWYRLPAFHRLNRAAFVARNGGLVYRNYFEVARRYMFRSNDGPVHPFRRGFRV